MNTYEIIILGVAVVVIIAVFFYYGKKANAQSLFSRGLSVFVSVGYGGYLLGTPTPFSTAKIVLIVIFLGNGIFQLIQLWGKQTEN